MLSEVDPQSTAVPTRMSTPPTPPAPSATVAPEVGSSGHARKGIFLLTAFVLFLAVCGAVLYVFFGAAQNALPEVNDATPSETASPSESPTAEATVSPTATPSDDVVSTLDTDGDGLLDPEEREAGTSLRKPDSDNDGLGDREELKVYKSDPLNPDSDNDSYLDGAEVKNGYNPIGPGKLLTLPNLKQ
jgi:hypothetical protein